KQDRAGGWRSAACDEGRCALGELPKSSRPANQPGARLSGETLRNTIRARFSIDSYGVLAKQFNGLRCDAARVLVLGGARGNRRGEGPGRDRTPGASARARASAALPRLVAAGRGVQPRFAYGRTSVTGVPLRPPPPRDSLGEQCGCGRRPRFRTECNR